MLRLKINIILICLIILGATQNANCQNRNDYETELLAAEYYRNGEFDKALILYEKIYKEKQDNLNYKYYLDCLLKTSNYEKAEKLVENLYKQTEKPQYAIDLGYVYKAKGNSTASDKHFEHLLKKLPASENKIIEFAEALVYRNELNLAISFYQKGRKILKNQTLFNRELGAIYEKQGNLTAMMDEYLAIIDADEGRIAEVQNFLQTTVTDDASQKAADALRAALMQRIQKNPNQTLFSQILLWLSLQIKDFEMAMIQAKALDRRAYVRNGENVLQVARICVSNQQYDIAIDGFNYIIQLGEDKTYFFSSKLEILNAKYLKILNQTDYTSTDLIDLEKTYYQTIEELQAFISTVQLYIDLAHLQAFYLNKPDTAIILLEQVIQKGISNAQLLAKCKTELADINLLYGDIWEATLLYQQVDKAFKQDPVGHEAKFRNARLSYFIGEFDWAKTQLDILRGATSKLIANDAMNLYFLISDNIEEDSSTAALQLFAKAELLSFRNHDAAALKVLDSLETLFGYHPIMDDVMLKKAKINQKLKNYTLADSFYNEVVAQYGFDILGDDALYARAQLNELFIKDKTKAMELYQQLILDYPGSVYLIDARRRFRTLRGDFIN